MKVYGKLERAQIEHVGALPSASVDKAKGRVVYLTTDDRYYISDGTNWHTIVTNDQSETLTNKTLTAPDMTSPRITSGPMKIAEQATPSTPASGYGNIYPKSDGYWYVQDDAGTETRLGAGAGGINYISNPDAESSTTGWATYADAAATTPVDGTGGAATTTFTRNTSSALRGTGDFLITKDAANRQGEGASYDFTIANADKGKVVRISFEYKTSSAYVDGDIRVYVYRTTATARLIELTARDLAANTVNGTYIGEFQADSDATGYRLIFHVSSTNASAYTVQVDNVQVGPREIARGSVVTDWVSYTPTGSMSSGGTYYGRWRRNGDSMEGQVYFVASGAVSPAGAFTINLPSGYTIDSSKLPNSLADYHVAVGSGQVIDNTVRGYPLITYINSTTSVGFRSAETTGSSSSDVEDDSPITFGANDTLSGNFKVPITGWSSNAVISSDFGGRIIAASAYRSGTQTGVNPNASAVKININSKTASGAVGFDTTNSFDVTTNFRYDVPETGYYNVNGAVNVNTTNVLNNTYFALLRVSGSNAAYGESANPEASQYFTASVSSILYLTAGQYVELFLYGVGNNSVSTLTVNASETYLNLYKIQSPQTLISGEKVLCRVHSSSTIVNSTSNVDLIFSTKSYDTHSAYNTSTGVFTSPRSGRLNIDTVFRSSAGVSAVAVGDAAYLYIANTTQSKTYMVQQLNAFTTTSVTRFLQGSIGIDVNSGDQIKIQAARDTNHGNITGGNTEFVTWADFKMEG